MRAVLAVTLVVFVVSIGASKQAVGTPEGQLQADASPPISAFDPTNPNPELTLPQAYTDEASLEENGLGERKRTDPRQWPEDPPDPAPPRQEVAVDDEEGIMRERTEGWWDHEGTGETAGLEDTTSEPDAPNILPEREPLPLTVDPLALSNATSYNETIDIRRNATRNETMEQDVDAQVTIEPKDQRPWFPVCNNHGIKDASGYCLCDQFWSGKACEVECYAHGTYNDTLGFCVCDEQFMGPDCRDKARCLDLQGKGWINVDNCHGLDVFPEDSLTIEAWVWVRRGTSVIVDKHGPMADETNYLLAVGMNCDDTRLALLNHVENPDLDWDAIVFSNTHMTVEQWHHVAAVYNGSHVAFFLDGVFDGLSMWHPGDANTGSLYIGRDSVGRFFDGVMAELRLWATVRTQKELVENMRTSLVGNEAGLTGYWPLDEQRGNRAMDKSDDRNNGLVYSPLWNGPCPPIRVASALDCPNNCSNRGQCLMGKCMCDAGWGGEMCSQPVCPDDCNNHGVCLNGRCLCTMGYTGVACELPECPNNCSGHGTCNDGRCECREGWMGIDCSREFCPNDCSNHGVCNQANGICICDFGYTGDACTLTECPANCSNHGVCDHGHCRCDNGWTGMACSETLCPANCSGHGYCLNSKCVCMDGYTGYDCSVAVCPADCNNRGKCVHGVCMCDDGWYGVLCQFQACPRNCSGHGQCVQGRCLCDELYGGMDCSQQLCPADCSGHGQCEQGVCICDPNWQGDICNRERCLNDCNQRGICVRGTCFCDDLWEGVDCSRPLTVPRPCASRCPDDCNGRGACVNGQCVCSGGWSGKACEIQECPNECMQRGKCQDGKCVCNQGYGALDCSLRLDGKPAFAVYNWAGQWYFNMLDAKGTVLLVSEPASTSEQIKMQTVSIPPFVRDPTSFGELKDEKTGSWYFTVRDQDQRVVARSPNYGLRETMQKAKGVLLLSTIAADAVNNVRVPQ